MRSIILFAAFFTFAVACLAQTPTSDRTLRVTTEEIKINITALDRNGKFVAEVKKEDLVINEDGRLHQASSLHFIPASVLIAMDTGGDNRQKKNIETTRAVAVSLVKNFRDDTEIALMDFHDKVEILSEWETDKSLLLSLINSRTGFGRRSSFSSAVGEAVCFFRKTKSENRHLVLITDGLDALEGPKTRNEAIKMLWESGIVVHVISYTQIEYRSFKPRAKIWREGDQNPKRMPEEVMETLAHSLPVRQIVAKEMIKQIYAPRLISVLTDIAFITSNRGHLRALATSHLQLSLLAEYTGGEFLLPETLEEIVDQASKVPRAINAQYVMTYVPRRPIKEVMSDEIRQIAVTSRRSDLDVQSSRKLIVFTEK